mmetsp:Transcript_4620/g.15160  ORF Transcript_4620/g.15160 Transcript_4620/m.15160 type:complete len:208 (+) Transcript_4620:2081-2704(+)
MHAWKPHAVAVHECHNCGVSRRPTAAPETIACMQSSKARASARSFESQVSLRTYTCAQASPRPARTLSIEKCETARCTGCSCEVGGGGKESEQENTLQSIRRTGARLHMRDGVSCLTQNDQEAERRWLRHHHLHPPSCLRPVQHRRRIDGHLRAKRRHVAAAAVRLVTPLAITTWQAVGRAAPTARQGLIVRAQDGADLSPCERCQP